MTEQEIFSDFSPIVCAITAGGRYGSGFITEKRNGYLYIATNSHVVAAALDGGIVNDFNIDIYGDDNENYQGGEISICGYDALSDIAVLKVSDKTPQKKRRLLKISNSLEASVGESVTAIGNYLGTGIEPYGGLISNPSAVVDYDGSGSSETRYKPRMRVSVDINKGLSGSPLINGFGAVLGISVSQGMTGGTPTAGVSYAVPYPLADTVIKKAILEDNGGGPVNAVDVFFLNGNCLSVAGLDFSVEKTDGGYTVKSASEHRSGLNENDIIVGVGGIDVRNAGFCGLLAILGGFADDGKDPPQSLKNRYTGKNLIITYLRDGQKRQVIYEGIKELKF
jgi:S1-C subfamily serine protease